MPHARLVGALLVLWGCGGRTGSAATEPPDGSAPDGSVASGLVFQDEFSQTAESGPFVAAQCFGFDAGLPVGDSGLPNCIVVSAQSPSDFPPEHQSSDCQCDAPGLAPLVTSVPLETIGEGLSHYGCLCAVNPLPPDAAGCDTNLDFADPSRDFWCYPDTDPPSGGLCLGFSMGLSARGTLYVACFDPQTTL